MRALLYLLLISINIVLPSVCFGQLVTTSNSIKEIISDDYNPKSGGAYFYNNPVNNWPACSAPSDLNFQLDGKGYLTLSWDGDEKQMQNYQYEIKFPEGVLNTDKNIVTVSRNKYNIRRSEIGARSDFSVSVRRKCFINKDILYSNWVTQEITLPEPANTNSETCPQILEYVNFIANSASGNEVNDTLYLFNFSFDSMDVKLTYNYWFSPWKSLDPPTIVSITTIKRVRFGSFYKIPIARIKPVEVVFAQKFHGGITTTLACPPVIVQPNACNVNAYVYHTKTNDLNENLVLVKVGVSNGILSGSIISNQDTILLVDGLGTIATCSDVTVNLSLQTIINGVNTTIACDPMIIENECLCTEPQSNINNRTFNVIQPNCDKSTGDVYTSFPIHLTSIGGEFSNTTSYNNLPPGVYYLRIKNIYTNCVSAPYMFTIDEQPPINEDVNAVITQQMGCNGEKGIIEISDPEVNYLYSLGGNFGTSTSFSNLNAGFYQVSSKNPQGCISISDTLWVIQANTPPTPQVTLIQPSCSPVVSTGTITVNSPTGSYYTYAVNSGTYQSSPVFSGLANGTYSVTVKSNITGCIAVLTNVTINAVPNMVIPNASVTIQPSCTVTTGTIFISSPIGPQYTYSVGGAYQSSRVFANLQIGTYNVTLKLSSGCISSPKVLTVNPNVPSASVTSQPTCTTITGTIGFTSPAGADFNYSINNGSTWQAGSTFSNLSPGTYLCKYKNTSTNCISQALTLVVNPPPTFAAPEVNLTQATCTDLFGSIQVVSPLGSEFSYSINTVEPNFQSSPVFSNKPSGIYSVKVRNNGSFCYSQITVVEISPLPALPATPSLSVEDPSCLISTGKISIDSPSGSDYVYSIDQINYSPVPVFTNLAPGNYSVTAKNIVSGCVSSSGTATVAEAPENEISAVITGANTLCLGDSTVLIASGGVSYSWNQNLGSGSAKLIYPIVNTTYTVTVTDMNGCTATSSKMIVITPVPELVISGNLNPCLNESTTLTASGGIEYMWSNNDTSSSISVSPISNTTYTVTVTGSNGCSSSESQNIEINSFSIYTITPSSCNSIGNVYSLTATIIFQAPFTGTVVFNDDFGITNSWSVNDVTIFEQTLFGLKSNGIQHNLIVSVSNCSLVSQTYQAPNSCTSCLTSITGNNSICQGGNTILTASAGNTYIWSNGATSQSISVSPSSSSTYSVTVNGACSATKTVTVNSSPQASILGPPNYLCTSNLPASLIASGGSTYLWSTGSNNPTISVSPSVATDYLVTVTSLQGCTSVASHQVIPITCSECQITIAGNTSVCIGKSTTLSVHNSKCAISAFLWSNGATSDSIDVAPIINTTYSVTVTDQNNHTSVAEISVNVGNVPMVSIIGNTEVCIGQETTLVASGGSTYAWSNGPVTADMTLSPEVTTTYTVTVTNIAGCSSTSSITVDVNCIQQCVLVSNAPTIGSCLNGLFTLSGSGYVTNSNENQLIVEVNGIIEIVPISSQYGSFTYTIPDLQANGQQQNVSIQMIGCDTITHSYIAPSSCNLSGNFSYSLTECNPGFNTFDLIINLNVTNPVPGQIITFTEGGTNLGSIVLSTLNSYSYTFDNIKANGENSNILMEAPWGNSSQQYVKPSGCTPQTCSIYDLELTSSECNKTTQKFSLDGVFYIDHPVQSGYFTISLVGTNIPDQIINSNGSGQYNFSFLNLTANGLEYNVNVVHTSACGNIQKLIKAPSGCNVLPEYLCGISTSVPPSTNSTPLANAYVGDVFIVSGMAFRCDTITGSNGLYTGVGSLSTPFSSKKLKVIFNNIAVNDDYHVTSGSVFGVRAIPGENYNIPQEAINIGGDICVVQTPPEGVDENGFNKTTGLNDRGFGMDGKFYPGGNTYDANGYDYNGNHKSTDGPYDRYGCDVQNLNVEKKPCYRDSTDIIKKDSIIGIVKDSISSLFENARDDIEYKLKALKCDSLSDRIVALIGILGFEGQSQYIVGATNQYLNKGMYKNFDSEPKLQLDNSGRDPNAVDLEKTHVSLYQCDLFKDKYEKALFELNEVDAIKFESFIIKEIYKLTKDQVDVILGDNIKMSEWVLSKLVEYAQNPDAYGLLLQPEIPANKLAEIPKRKAKSSAYHSTAGLDDYSFVPEKGSEEKWLFNQGFSEINGVNRGYYLEALYEQMQQESNIGGLSTNEENVLMPLPLIKDVEGLPYKIFLDNIELSPSGAKLNAFFVFQDPTAQNSQKIVMMAENINFGPGGLIGETKLKLKNPIDLRLNNAVSLHLLPAPASGNGGCSVSWDCKGFNSFNLDGKVELCRNFIIPLNPVTKDTLPAPARYSFDFNLDIKGWHDIYLEFNNNSSKPFAIAGYTDFKWLVSGVVIDNSDFKSPSGITFIEGYTSEHLSGTGSSAVLSKSWRGVAMKTLAVTLPPVFNNNGAPVTTGVQNLLIDDTGANGRIFATPLIPYETGNLAGWQFSLDTLKIDILRNHINGGGLSGRIRVPVLKNPSRYSASIYSGGKFQFSISPALNDKMDFLLADVTLDKNSLISVTVNKGDADVYAVLNGTIEIQGGKLNIPKITFENFKIGNKDPYFNAGTWKIENKITAKLFGFDLNISNIKPFSSQAKTAGVSFDIKADLPLKINAGGGLEVVGKMESDNFGRQNWVYETTKVNKFLIDGKIAAGHLYGFLETFDNQSSDGYGEGFHGMIEMDFTSLAKVEAVALFASKNNEKFFFVDAAVSLSKGIPVGPFSITGFAGGASFMMEETFSDNDPPDETKKTLPKPGVSLSGTRYIYNPTRGLGLKAGISFALASSSEAFNGSLVFGILFNTPEQGGGVANVSMDGKGQFMMKAKITGPKIESDSTIAPSGVPGKIKAHVRFVYDFNKKEFSGRMAAFIRAPGINGEGKVQILANRSLWYLYIGTPTEPVFLDFSLKPFGTVRGETYLDIGSLVPDMKPIPPNVRAVAYKVKQSPLRASGGGFVFGVSLRTKMIADAKIATAELNAEIGFDVMLRNFGNASCGATPGEKIGINGWYAMGQLYAFMEGKLKIFGVNIFSAAIAGVLQAELPNPFFGQATLGVKVKTFLGSFNKNIALVLGKRCEIAGDPSVSPLGMKVISAVNPADMAQKMETDFIPGASFNMPLNTPIEMGTDIWKPYLKKYSLTSLKNGHVYAVDSIFSPDRGTFEAKPKSMFFSGDSIKFEVEVMVTKNGGSPIYESQTSIFTVGNGYTNLPKSNIESSYPIDGMKSYYRKENVNNTGFIQLQQGMPELFYNIPKGVTQKIKISSNSGDDPTYIDYTYDGLKGRVNFDMNPAWFINGQEYTLALIRSGSKIETIPSSGGQTAGQLGSAITLGGALGNPSGPSPSSNSEEAEEQTGEIILTSLTFKVSTFDKFLDKLNSGSVITRNGNQAYEIGTELIDNIEKDLLIDLKLNDPSNWMTVEAYNKIFTKSIDLSPFDCGIVTIENGSEKFDDLNNQIFIENENNKSYFVNNIYSKALGYYQELTWKVNGCDLGIYGNPSEAPTALDDFSIDIWYLTNFPLNPPSPPLDMIVTYTIPGLGTTSTKTLSF